MIVQKLKQRRFWKRLILTVLVIPVILFSITIGIIYAKQGEIVQQVLKTLNTDFKGELALRDSHVEPFSNFPYISIDLEGVKVYETKSDHKQPIAEISEVFLGFKLWSILGGKMNIDRIKLKDGRIDLVQHINGQFNVEIALSSDSTKGEEEEVREGEALNLKLSKITCENIDIHKLNEESDLIIDALIYQAEAKFSTKPEHTYVFLDSEFELNLIQEGDTSFIRHKHFEVHTQLDYLTLEEVLHIQPTTIQLENSEFELQGNVDFRDDFDLDLAISGNKENFDLLFAMVPEEMAPVLARYQNKGRLFFEASVKGKSIHGQSPAIVASFGCERGFFKNTNNDKVVDELNFNGFFTNGEARDLSTMELRIKDFSAHPESGKVSAALSVINFKDPEIEFQVNSAFELAFLVDFFNLTEVGEMSGSVELQMNFHDIVNFDAPEHAIEKLNEAYYSRFQVQDLKFQYGPDEIPLHDLDLLIEMNGHQAEIKYCDILLGKSDLSLKGQISDLPAVLHHSELEIETRLDITSRLLDLYELSGADSNAVDEQIRDLALRLRFKSNARALTESPHLPVGEFFIDSLFAKLQHYPHALHDFHADILIGENDLEIIDFKGMIDESDFLFSGKVKDYDLWLAEVKNGESKVEFDFSSSILRLEDVFSYQGENYVPEEYRHEELKGFRFHGLSGIQFKDSLHAIDLQLDQFDAKMKLHPLKFEQFNGRIHYEPDHLVIEDFSGKLGRSDFKTTLHYYLGKDAAARKRANHFSFLSNFLNVDEIITYNPNPTAAEEPADHDSAFNVFELPFTDMTYEVDVNKLNYQQYRLANIHSRMRTTPNHYLYLDSLSVEMAGGRIATNGYFNGSDPNLIYFSPDMYIDKVDLDQVLLKFENFGQDHLVSENLHGEFTGRITGKIHLYPDLVPIIDDSEIHIDAHVENGRLENYKLLESFSDYFKDKNLSKVIFDTLENHLDITNGVMYIPKMTVNTSLGFLEISGKQDMDFNYEYDMYIPWKLVTQAASSKLFKKKKEEVDPEQVDEIQYGSENIKYVYIMVRGNAEDYSIKLGKKKKRP